ncbi:hypothetical protein BH23ACT9_BH23ACT9_03990 [soil metagenome]
MSCPSRVGVQALVLALTLVVSLLALAVPAEAQELRLGVPVGARSDRTAWSGGTASSSLTHVAQVIGAPQSSLVGPTGAGVGVALIDTGVARVPGLTDIVAGPDLSLDSPFAEAHQLDAYGHGTHLAGIITSDRSDARGMAPDATLVSVKVGAHNGAVDVSQVIAAIDWVVARKADHNIRVLVLAYGTDGVQDPQVDPLAHAVQTAWRHGIVVVVAAGNEGQLRPQMANPATDPYVISVGAIDTFGTNRTNDDSLAAFSAPGTPQRRPDVVAPGVGIVSTSAPGSFIEQTYPAAVRPEGLLRGNGTSQAAAVVGGAAAVLLQERPWLTPDQVKAVLTSTATPVRGGDPGTGSGLVNLHWARTAPAPTSTQTHPTSLGTGTLEGARGSHHLVGDGVILQGEVDIMGQPFDSAAWAQAASAGASWDEGVWNGVQWTGWSWNGWSWNGWSWNGVQWD